MDIAVKIDKSVYEKEVLEQALARQANGEIVVESAGMRACMMMVHNVAATDVSVLLSGETGTGKDLLAQAIHRLSKRQAMPFIAVNCAAVPAELLESEFFGHEKGAFSGAVARRYGLFEFAAGGTLFLDEIADMPIALQSKLLRVLDTRRIRRLGGNDEFPVDVRIVSATNRPIDSVISDGRLRQDLFYRIAGAVIQLPPLRLRPDAIPLLAKHFFMKHGGPMIPIEGDVLAALRAYSWPGNVRELEHVLARLKMLARDVPPRFEFLPEEIRRCFKAFDGKQTAVSTVSAPAEIPPKTRVLGEIERDYILKVLKECGWNKPKAAGMLGISLNTLYRRLKSYESNDRRKARKASRVPEDTRPPGKNDATKFHTYSSILDSIPEPMVLTDTSDIIVFVNRGFTRQYGYTPGELAGKHINVLRHPDADRTVMNVLHKKTAEDGRWEGFITNITKDGLKRQAWLTTFVIHDRDIPIAKTGVDVEIPPGTDETLASNMMSRTRALSVSAHAEIMSRINAPRTN